MSYFAAQVRFSGWGLGISAVESGGFQRRGGFFMVGGLRRKFRGLGNCFVNEGGCLDKGSWGRVVCGRRCRLVIGVKLGRGLGA